MSPDTLAIETKELSKRYNNSNVLDRVTLQVASGSIFGFLGPNGAGKTTTLRLLTGLARPTSGEARIFGLDVVKATNESRAKLGFLPDVPGFYPWMRADEFLSFAGSLFGLSLDILRERVPTLLDLAGLTGVSTRIGGFSRGMKQRLGIAQALINAPRLLMLDEPTSALDPIGRREVLAMISALSGRVTVFFSTHILADVERVCDHVAILSKGRVMTQSSIAELKERYVSNLLVLEVTDGLEQVESALSGVSWLSSVSKEGSQLLLRVKDLPTAEHEIPKLISGLNLGLKRFEAKEPTLEEVFVHLIKEGT